MDSKDVIITFSQELTQKKIKVESLKDLKSGSLFLQAIHIHYPKYVDLTKIYLRPKNSFEVLQNYKQLMSIFSQLGWKRIDPEKYVKQQDKDCLEIANFIIKKILLIKQKKKKQYSMLEATSNNESKVDFQYQSNYLKVEELNTKKQKLLDKLTSIEHILEQAIDPKIAKNLIIKILQE